jgi:hypothetical protein
VAERPFRSGDEAIPSALIGAHKPILNLSVAMFWRGIGMGFTFMPAMAAAFASLERFELWHGVARGRAATRTRGRAYLERRRRCLWRRVLGGSGRGGWANSGNDVRGDRRVSSAIDLAGRTGASSDPDRRQRAAAQLGRSFKGAMAAVRRLRGRETRHPGELSDAQYGLLFGLCEHRELSANWRWPPTCRRRP